MSTRRFFAATVFLIAFSSARSPAGDGIAKIQDADPSCTSSPDRVYVDCGNGTVTDTRNGLVWLQNTDCLPGAVDWQTAMIFVAGLADLPGDSAAAVDDCGLADGSSPGEWRLPSSREWRQMVEGATPEGLDCTPSIMNDHGSACWSQECFSGHLCAFSGIEPEIYWSGETPLEFLLEKADLAMYVDLADGDTAGTLKTNLALVWPVRGGQ